jgi:hypothetical protein
MGWVFIARNSAMDYLIDEMREARMNDFHRAMPSQIMYISRINEFRPIFKLAAFTRHKHIIYGAGGSK